MSSRRKVFQIEEVLDICHRFEVLQELLAGSGGEEANQLFKDEVVTQVRGDFEESGTDGCRKHWWMW